MRPARRGESHRTRDRGEATPAPSVAASEGSRSAPRTVRSVPAGSPVNRDFRGRQPRKLAAGLGCPRRRLFRDWPPRRRRRLSNAASTQTPRRRCGAPHVRSDPGCPALNRLRVAARRQPERGPRGESTPSADRSTVGVDAEARRSSTLRRCCAAPRPPSADRGPAGHHIAAQHGKGAPALVAGAPHRVRSRQLITGVRARTPGSRGRCSAGTRRRTGRRPPRAPTTGRAPRR